MSQSQYAYNTFQSTTQSQIYNQSPNQDVAYTQQQAFSAAAPFQYSIPPQQDAVMMQMNPYQQQMSQIIVNQNQNNLTTNKTNTKDEKDEQDIMPNKQVNPKLPKQKVTKSSKKEAKSKTKSSKSNDKKKSTEENKKSLSTAYPDDLLDLERNSGVPEFIKKLYRLLEDQSYKSIISWGDKGDSFVVKDATEFSRNVLPKHFKHNNFASFVRQLNKYDFHKVKVDKINSYGENIWEFKHPNFQLNKKDQLELIKRKVSNKNPKVQELKQQSSSNDIQQQVNSLIEVGSEIATNLDQLTSSYSDFSENYINFGKFMELQSKTLKSLVDFVIDKEAKKKSTSKNNNSFKTLVNNYKFWNLNIQVAQDSFNKFQTNINENIEKMKNTREKIRTLNDSLKKSISSVKYMDSKYSMNVDDTSTIENILKSNKDKNQNTENIVDNVNNITNLNIVTTATTAAATVATTNELLNNGVTTQNNVALLPSDNNYIPMNTNTILINSNTNPLATTFDPKATMNLNVSSSSTPPIEIKTSPPTRTVSLPLQNSDLRATTSLVKSVKKPKWSQPPRVLLVEDDAICRSVSSKLLQIFGCKFDVAVDGQYAIERMGNKKYDIVLMDIMMPRVDGVTATKSIRQFDQLTPIISMTSNTTENDCITYLSNGMNDVLPKPFNKNGLLTVLERYCSHLRHMNETSIDPGFSKTIMMIGSNDNNVNNSIIGFNWNNNVETSQGRITELHDDDISNATANNSSSSSNSNTITNNNANVSTTSSINVGPVISNVNPVNVTTQVPNTDQVLLSMYNEKGTTSNLDTMTMPNYNNVTLQPQIAIQDTQNVNVQYYSSIPNPTIITSHIQSPPNQLQTTTPQIIPTSTADPTLMQNPILLTTNNIVLPSNQNQSTFIPNDPNSILGKRKADNDLRLINKTIST